MKSFHLLALPVLASLVILPAPRALAQNEAPATPENPERPRGPTFRVSTWGTWAGPELFVAADGSWKPIELIDLGYSQDMPFSRDQPVILARKMQTDKGERYMPFISISVAKEIAAPLILLVPDGKGSARSFVVDLAPNAFPWGSYQFVNFTDQNFDSQVGNERFQLPSSKSKLVNPQKTENTRLPILVRTGTANNWTTVYSTMVINRPSKRMLLFFHPGKGPGGEANVEARCLVDFRQNEAR